MKIILSLLFLLGSFANAGEIVYWNGSGTSLTSENGNVWEAFQCDKTLGMYTQTSEEYLLIGGGLCYRLDVGVFLKNDSGNLILTKSAFGFTAPWTSNDIGKVVGKVNGKSFVYSFTLTNADKVLFIIQGKMDVQADGRTANILFSQETHTTSGQKYKVEVSGVVVK